MLEEPNLFGDDEDDGSDLLSVGSFNLADDLIRTQIIPTQLDPPILIEFGQNHPDWILFLTSLSESSKPRYEKAIMDFVAWVSAREDTSLPPEQHFRDYFVMIHDLNNRPLAPPFAASRYRCLASIFVRFWSYSGLFSIIFYLNFLKNNNLCFFN